MKRTSIIKASNAQNICIFCSCQLDPASTFLSNAPARRVSTAAIGSRRPSIRTSALKRATFLNTSRTFQRNDSSAAWTPDPNSPLSLSEQKEKFTRMEAARKIKQQQQEARSGEAKQALDRRLKAAASVRQSLPAEPPKQAEQQRRQKLAEATTTGASQARDRRLKATLARQNSPPTLRFTAPKLSNDQARQLRQQKVQAEQPRQQEPAATQTVSAVQSMISKLKGSAAGQEKDSSKSTSSPGKIRLGPISQKSIEGKLKASNTVKTSRAGGQGQDHRGTSAPQSPIADARKPAPVAQRAPIPSFWIAPRPASIPSEQPSGWGFGRTELQPVEEDCEPKKRAISKINEDEKVPGKHLAGPGTQEQQNAIQGGDSSNPRLTSQTPTISRNIPRRGLPTSVPRPTPTPSEQPSGWGFGRIELQPVEPADVSQRGATPKISEGEKVLGKYSAGSDAHGQQSAISRLASQTPTISRDIPGGGWPPSAPYLIARPENPVVEQQASTAQQGSRGSLRSSDVPRAKPPLERPIAEHKSTQGDENVRARPQFIQPTWKGVAGSPELDSRSFIAERPDPLPKKPAEPAPAESTAPKNEPTVFVPFGQRSARLQQPAAISRDNFIWPAQPGRSSGQDGTDGNRTVPARHEDDPDGYRTVPVRHEDLIVNESPAGDVAIPATWQHVRPKHALPEDVPEEQSDVLAQPFSIPSEEIEQSFSRHVRTRRSYQVPDQSAHNSNNTVTLPPSASRSDRCGRCGQPGHIARNCPRESLFRRIELRDDGASGIESRKPSEAAPSPEIRRFVPFSPKQSESSTASNASLNANQRSQADFEEPGSSGRKFLFDKENSASGEDRRDKWAPRENAYGNDVSTSTRGSNRRDKWAREAADDEDATVGRRSSNTKSSRKDRSDRRDRYEVDEDDDYVATTKSTRGSDRKGGRSSRDEDDEGAAGREEARARKQARQAERAAQMAAERAAAQAEREARAAAKTLTVKLPEFVSVQNLAQALDVRYERFVDRLEDLGYEDIFPGKIFNSEISGMIALEYNYEPIFETGAHEDDNRDLKALPASEQNDLPPRPPVVTIMGHVDHGKTTILDYIRKSSVAAGEAGGITQHIGAFSVPMTSSSKPVTFLDTPGHEAFLAMRQRGANVTDIVILVVAADDSVKPQTLEAIKHAKAAKVPIIVAVNKVDKEEANVDRVKQDLARHGIDIEDYGGETQVVPVSGKTGLGMDVLEENIVTLSEILDHRASTDGQVEGWVIESSTKLSGRVATVLIRRGTLRVGDIIVAGKTWARARTLKNEAGEPLEEVGPGMPVEVDGWNEQPAAGDEVLQAPNEQKATSVVEFRIEKQDRERIAEDMQVINANRQEQQIRHAKEKAAKEELRRKKQAAWQAGMVLEVAEDKETEDRPAEEESGQKLIPFIIKADVSGSVEAVSAYVLGVSHPLIAPKIIHADVGAIHESDIDLAEAAKGHIIAFNLPTSSDIRHSAETKGIKILENNIIYRVLDDVRAVLEAALPPLISKKVIGEADIGQAFSINIRGRKYQKIAGCKIRNGSIKKGSLVRVIRDGEEIYDGTITSLKNVKKDVEEMRKGTECGMGFSKWEDFEVGDQIQTYEKISEKRHL